MQRKTLHSILFGIMLLLIIIPILFPFIWMLMSSFKTQVDIISWPPKFIFTPVMQNYERVFIEQDFLHYMKNSVIVSVVSVFFSLILGLPAAYSIARYKQKKLSVFILVARLMPGISFLMPWYIVFSRLHLMDSYIA
ncbi:MAG: carbohydrate ABC transporter permease, partial [Sphaerochaeta sp.]|nr:carbohydrate ABC transporter permease [Sphaerochaeta sp.]